MSRSGRELLAALRAKGETPPELAGLLGALMKRVVPPASGRATVADIVGTVSCRVL